MPFKAHIIIIATLIGLIFLGYNLGTRFKSYKRQAADVNSSIVDETVFIQFSDATFGHNCNGRIMGVSVAQKLGMEKTDVIVSNKKYTIENNNALTPVTNLCGKAMQCKIIANENILGFDPAPGCEKKLKVSYRCFNFDVIKENEVPYNGEMLINCNSNSK